MNELHLKPNEKIARNSGKNILAVLETNRKLSENTGAIKDMHQTLKDSSASMLGFIGVVRAIKSLGANLLTLVSHINNPIKVTQKLEEIKSASLITNQELKKIVKKEYPKVEIPKVDFSETNKLLLSLTEEVKKKEQSEIEIDPETAQRLKGKDGEHGKNADEEKIFQRLLEKIPKVENGKPGKDAVLDEKKLLKDVLKIVRKELPKIDTMNQHGTQVGGGANTLIHLSSGTRLSEYVTEINYGSGITAVYSGSGRITLTSTGGAGFTGSQEKSTTTPNGVLTTFSFAHTPTIIYWNGQFLTLTDDYTVSLLTITFTASAGIPQTGDKIVNLYA